MELTNVAWTDADAVRRLVAVTNAARQVDSPWLHPLTEHECVGELRHGWDGDPAVGFLATVDGVDVGAARYEVSSYDNEHLAWFEVEIAPERRRRTHGTAVLEALIARARSEGRTSVGIAGWDAPGPRAFALRHGFVQKSVEVHRRQVIDGPPGVVAPVAPDYELLRWPARTPPHELPALAHLTAAINDAPTDDLDIEDEVFPPERIAAYEEAWARAWAPVATASSPGTGRAARSRARASWPSTASAPSWPSSTTRRCSPPIAVIGSGWLLKAGDARGSPRPSHRFASWTPGTPSPTTT